MDVQYGIVHETCIIFRQPCGLNEAAIMVVVRAVVMKVVVVMAVVPRKLQVLR